MRKARIVLLLLFAPLGFAQQPRVVTSGGDAMAGTMQHAAAGGERVMRSGPTAPASTDVSAPVAVPLGQAGHLVTVAAKLNGKGPYQFVIDSGAGGMMRVSSRLVQDLVLEQIGEVLAGDPSGKNPERRPVVRIASVEIGGARFTGVDAGVAGNRGPETVDGVIGLSLFSGLTATIDYPKQELRLTREQLPASGPNVIAFTTPKGIPVIEVEAAGVKFAADVDTGSPALLNVPPSIALPFNGEPQVIGKGRTVSNEFEIKRAELNGELRVAGQSKKNPGVDLVDLFPIAHVGSQFLRQYAVSFDMVNRRLALR